MKKSLIPKTTLLLVLISACCGLAFAQPSQREGTGKIKLPDPKGNKPVPRKPRNLKPIPGAGIATETPSTGSLTVIAEPGASVYLESVGKQKADNREGKIARRETSYIANGLKPGRYRVLVELAGYEDADGKDGERFVEVEPEKGTKVEFRLRPTHYDFTIKTNLSVGEVTYGAVGETKTTSKVQNGGARLQNLPAGKYEIEIRASGYVTWKGIVDVGEGKTELNKNLEIRRSTEPLSASWVSLESWDVPKGWSVNLQKLQVSGEGIALHRNINYRNYADFNLVTDVRMVNSVAASFVIRAQDKQNYYLIQLTGSGGDKPFMLFGYVVRNGTPHLLQDPIYIGAWANILTGRFFELTINCVGNKFKVSISDSNTGDTPTLGVLTDLDRYYSNGAPGIAARAREQNEIGRFFVAPIANNQQ
ncbi:MAG: hypothetical protein AB7U82_23950 [Blastocatellales bacterium]